MKKNALAEFVRNFVDDSHPYFQQMLEANSLSHIAALQYAHEVGLEDRQWDRQIDVETGTTLHQRIRKTIAIQARWNRHRQGRRW